MLYTLISYTVGFLSSFIALSHSRFVLLSSFFYLSLPLLSPSSFVTFLAFFFSFPPAFLRLISFLSLFFSFYNFLAFFLTFTASLSLQHLLSSLHTSFIRLSHSIFHISFFLFPSLYCSFPPSFLSFCVLTFACLPFSILIMPLFFFLVSSALLSFLCSESFSVYQSLFNILVPTFSILFRHERIIKSGDIYNYRVTNK
jgi:hypothetical protein